MEHKTSLAQDEREARIEYERLDGEMSTLNDNQDDIDFFEVKKPGKLGIANGMVENIYKKLLQAQMEIGAIKKESDNPFFHSKYFDINAILAEVKPVLNKHGLVLTQAIRTNGKIERYLGIETTITDSESGVQISSFVEIPNMPDPQKTGSAITYYRRYSLQSFLALEAEDDDGNVASAKPKTLKNEKSFMKDLAPTEKEIITQREKLESAKDLNELKSIWKTIPPLVQDKLAKLKDELKFNLT